MVEKRLRVKRPRKGLGTATAIRQSPCEMAGPPCAAIALVAETQIRHRHAAMRGFQDLAETCQHRGARRAVADDLDGQKIGRRFPQETEQAGDLARRAGEKHAAPGLQGRTRLPKRVAQIALDILGATQSRKPCIILRRRMDCRERRPLPTASEDKASRPQHGVGQSGKHPARGTVAQQCAIGHPRGETGRRAIRRSWPQHRAGPLARPAPHASRHVHDRPEKTLRVRLHDDGPTGARRPTSPAPRAILRLRQCHDRDARRHSRPTARTLKPRPRRAA